MLVLDIETNTADGSLVCVGWAVDDGPLKSAPSLPDEVRSRLADADEVVVTHTGYDVRYLREQGVVVNAQMHDTQVMAWLVNENMPLDLANLAQRFLGVTLDKTLQKQAGKVPYSDIASYCEVDVDVTRQLHDVLKVWLERDGLWEYFLHTEAPFTKTLRDMEARGLPVNLPATARMEEKLSRKSEALASKLTQDLPSGFNLRAPVDVANFLGAEKFTVKDRMPKGDYEAEQDLAKLADDGSADPGEGFETNWEDVPVGSFIATKVGRLWAHGYWVVEGKGKGFEPLTSVAKDKLPLRLFGDPWVKDYLEYKKYDKVVGTYLKVFQERAVSGRVHGRFNQTGTVTGRLSSSEPNLQNIPARGSLGDDVRDLFQGNLVVGDFSQLEPRLMAHFSQDPAMLALFQSGGDIYLDIAAAAGCPRQVAKTLVLAMGYGAGAQKLAETLISQGFPNEAARTPIMLADLKVHYETYFEWRDTVIAEARARGYVETLDGRRRRIELGGGYNWKDKGQGERQAANAIIQGSAADVVRRVMLHTTRMFPELRLLAQVHDELVWEYDPPLPADTLMRLETWVKRIAEAGLSVPLVFEPHAGTTWHRAKEGI